MAIALERRRSIVVIPNHGGEMPTASGTCSPPAPALSSPEDSLPRRQLATVRDALAPQLSQAGAGVLLAIAIELMLAGGSSVLSYSDLTAHFGCSRASIAQARRLGARLGLIQCRPGARVGGRPGPAPLTWELTAVLAAPPTTGASEEPVLDPRMAPVTATTPANGAVSAPIGTESQPVASDQIHRNQERVSHDSDQILLDDLIADTAARLGERWVARLDRALRPVLARLLREGRSRSAIRAVIDDAVTATVAYQPKYPAAYLMSVMQQRLAWGEVGARPDPSTPRAPRQEPTLAGRAREAQAVVVQPIADIIVAPMPVPASPAFAHGPASDVALPLPLDAVWLVAREELVRSRPDLSSHLPMHPRMVYRAAVVHIYLPTAWLAQRLSQAPVRSVLERAVSRCLGRTVSVACLAGGDTQSPLTEQPVQQEGEPRRVELPTPIARPTRLPA